MKVTETRYECSTCHRRFDTETECKEHENIGVAAREFDLYYIEVDAATLDATGAGCVMHRHLTTIPQYPSSDHYQPVLGCRATDSEFECITDLIHIWQSDLGSPMISGFVDPDYNTVNAFVIYDHADKITRKEAERALCKLLQEAVDERIKAMRDISKQYSKRCKERGNEDCN